MSTQKIQELTGIMQRLRREKGAILLYVIATMVVAAVIGAAMVKLTTTSTYTELTYNPSDQARTIAQSGLKYALTYLQENNENDAEIVAAGNALHDRTLFTDSGPQFTLAIPEPTIDPATGMATFDTIRVTGTVYPGTSREARFEIGMADFTVALASGGIPEDNGALSPSIYTGGDFDHTVGGGPISQQDGKELTVVVKGDLDLRSEATHFEVQRLHVGGNLSANRSMDVGVPGGEIHIGGDLILEEGQANVYGTVYVGGDLDLKDAITHGILYVAGDVMIKWTPAYDNADVRIYYRGTLSGPEQLLLQNDVQQHFIHVPEDVHPLNPDEPFPLPIIPQLRIVLHPQDWYTSRGYDTSNNPTVASGMRVYAKTEVGNRDVTITLGGGQDLHDIIVINPDGDIRLEMGGTSEVSGILVASNGSIIFPAAQGGNFFEGIVIASDSFLYNASNTETTLVDPSSYTELPYRLVEVESGD